MVTPTAPRPHPLLIACFAFACLLAKHAHLSAQGVTTSAIRGTVVASDGSVIDGARVRVANMATGYSVHAHVRMGRFRVHGLEVGTEHVVTLDHVGFRQEQQRIVLRLGELRDLHLVMQPQAIQLTPLVVTTDATERNTAHWGGAAVVSDSMIGRLPTPNRNVYDFVSLAPQISTKIGFQRSGVSAAGANSRFNNYLIDGAEERFVNGNVSAAFNIGKSIPLDAVKAYEVLVAPYDVRYGDFAGALINTVTVSGTNELRGSTFASLRNDRLARGTVAGGSPYERLQYGFTVGGPIVRDRVHFFLASEFQRLTFNAPGPYVGQAPDATPPVPVREADVARMQDIMVRSYGLRSGAAEFVQLSNPLRNVFARVDAAVPRWRSRASAFITLSSAEDERFTRIDPRTFALSTYQQTLTNGLRMASLQLHTSVAGAHNELVFSHSGDWGNFQPDVRQPLVRVFVPGTSGDVITLVAGSAEQAQGRFGRAWSLGIRDDLSVTVGADHVVRLGVHAQQFKTTRTGVIGGYGVWTFASLDAFEQGVAGRYELRRALAQPSTVMKSAQYAAWVGDEWRVTDDVSVTFGVRMDMLDVGSHAPYNAEVDSIFGRRTDDMPAARAHVSPRFGFAWNVSDEGRGRLRGGIGIFTGRPSPAWFVPALTSYGVGIGVLRCGLGPGDAGPPPSFEPDYRAAPTSCATGRSIAAAPFGDVDVLDRHLRMAQSLRASLAYDRQLPRGVLATTELLVSRNISDFMFVNLNLQGPQSVDRFGRVLYGGIDTNGDAAPALRSDFAEVIDLRNTSRNYSYQVSARAQKDFAHGIAGAASYTYSRVRDVQSPSRVNLPGITLWGDARAVSGRHDDLTPGVSLNDLPHRVVGAITYTAPWQRASTELSLYYVGESGTPFTYLVHGIDPRGDLNADGSATNDPIYVPVDAFDANEVLFSGSSEEVRAQQSAFASFIAQSPCLRRQRGQIMARNSCREPTSHTTVAALRQAIPIGRHRMDAGLEVFNVLNLLDRDWGVYRIAQPQLLEHVGQTAGPAGATQPVLRFPVARTRWTTIDAESSYQLQLTLRYRF